mgnify:CR=1 FL=1
MMPRLHVSLPATTLTPCKDALTCHKPGPDMTAKPCMLHMLPHGMMAALLHHVTTTRHCAQTHRQSLAQMSVVAPHAAPTRGRCCCPYRLPRLMAEPAAAPAWALRLGKGSVVVTTPPPSRKPTAPTAQPTHCCHRHLEQVPRCTNMLVVLYCPPTLQLALLSARLPLRPLKRRLLQGWVSVTTNTFTSHCCL